MAGLLISADFERRNRRELDEIEARSGVPFERITLPEDPDARLGDADCARVEMAHFSGDMFPELSSSFFSAMRRAGSLRWFHTFSTGTDHPIFRVFTERNVALTNSSGANALAIAQTAIAGLLMLARGFPHWLDAQARGAWELQPMVPRSLDESTLVVVGLGAIGGEIARLGQALGLTVIGVRRSPVRSSDPVDECVTPDELPRVLPRADFLALACPLTDATRQLIDASALALLPAGARVLNIARGAIIDESALIEALRSGSLGGAYLDVFATEPLPAESPLWSLPNVILTPHNSAASSGQRERESGYFLRNLLNWLRKEDLENRIE